VNVGGTLTKHPEHGYERVGTRNVYIDKKGQVVIDSNLSIGADFSEGLAIVEANGKRGFIDKTGTLIIAPQFDWCREFSDGLALIRIDSNYGYIDKTGKYIWRPSN
jgi:hypothetical protein